MRKNLIWFISLLVQYAIGVFTCYVVSVQPVQLDLEEAQEIHRQDSLKLDSVYRENTMLKMLTTPETIEMLRQAQ